MGFSSKVISKHYDGNGYRSSESIKFLLSDWEYNYNRNFPYNKWTTEAVTLPAADDYNIKKYDDTVQYNGNDGGTGVLYYKNPAFVLTFIFLVGVFVLPCIFYLLVKLCLKVDICPSYIRRPSLKGSIQPANVHTQPSRTRVQNNYNYNTNQGTGSHTDDGVVISEDGRSSRIVNVLVNNTHNAITQTNFSHCLDLNDCFSIRILGQDSDGISSLPPSYEEAISASNINECSVEGHRHNGEGGSTSTNDCGADKDSSATKRGEDGKQ